MNILQASGFTILSTAVVGWALLFFAVQGGYMAATNESIDYADMRANLTGAIDSAQHTAYSNMSGARETAVNQSLGGFILRHGQALIGTGVDYGYTYPEASWWWMKLSPVGVLGGGGLYTVLTLRKRYRENRHEF